MTPADLPASSPLAAWLALGSVLALAAALSGRDLLRVSVLALSAAWLAVLAAYLAA